MNAFVRLKAFGSPLLVRNPGSRFLNILETGIFGVVWDGPIESE
jgi:hypothetical protein